VPDGQWKEITAEERAAAKKRKAEATRNAEALAARPAEPVTRAPEAPRDRERCLRVFTNPAMCD
jgi:hypothetical protein